MIQKNKGTGTVVIAGLVVVAAVLGYMLYQERQNSVEINLPGVRIQAN